MKSNSSRKNSYKKNMGGNHIGNINIKINLLRKT